MTAEEAIDQLIREIRPPEGNIVTLRERKPQFETDTNWIPGTSLMPDEVLDRYVKAVIKLRDQQPRLDWVGVKTFDGEEKHLSRYSLGRKT